MEERDFSILETLYKTGNITKASELLYITQSALSKRIAAIESELGITLLLRSRQGIRFTPEGECVLAHTRRASDEMAHMRAEIRESLPYISGTLHAGISLNFAQYSLPEILSSYHDAVPHVRAHIITGQSRDLYEKLIQGELDIAIVRGDYPYQENRILLSRERICLITSDQDRDKELASLPYINRHTDIAYLRLVNAWMRENDIKGGDGEMLVNNLATCVEMVSRGLGWAIVPEICLSSFTGYKRPLYFRNGEPLERPTYLLVPTLSEQLLQVKTFMKIVQEYNFR